MLCIPFSLHVQDIIRPILNSILHAKIYSQLQYFFGKTPCLNLCPPITSSRSRAVPASTSSSVPAFRSFSSSITLFMTFDCSLIDLLKLHDADLSHTRQFPQTPSATPGTEQQSLNGPLPAVHCLHARFRCNVPLIPVSQKRNVLYHCIYTHTEFESEPLLRPDHLGDFVWGCLCRASTRQGSFDPYQ